MADRDKTSGPSWLSTSTSSSSNVRFRVCGVPFCLDRDLLAARSAKVAALLKKNPLEDLPYLLQNIPGDPETFELIARFCHGFELQLSSENVLPLACVAHYLGMNETQSKNNLLRKALTFFEQRVLPSWNETIKALRTVENSLQQAADLGLLDACLDSIITKALVDPRLLGEPIKNSMKEKCSEDDGDSYRPNARRRLFVLDWQSEDLTTVSLQLYEPIIQTMNQRRVPPEYVAASICKYAQEWVFARIDRGENMSVYKSNSQKDVIEAVERLLPHQGGLLPCSFLFEMLKCANILEASAGCRNGFEIRIGRQLDQATANDLLIPSQGYAKEVKYDVECLRRILKIFYSNYTTSDILGFLRVAELMEEFLMEIASNRDLKTSTFISVAEMSVAASFGTQRNSDGIYRAIDIYLEKHAYLSESEREELCKVLDCHKMSHEACEHAAKNERLPLRVVVQVLFVTQLQLRDMIAKEVECSDDKLKENEDELEKSSEEDENEAKLDSGEAEIRLEMEKMSNKVLELERKCYLMTKEIGKGCIIHGMKKEKISVWGEMKRKFGCVNGIHDCSCQVKKKKVHPKY